jgi:hypothetical protein
VRSVSGQRSAGRRLSCSAGALRNDSLAPDTPWLSTLPQSLPCSRLTFVFFQFRFTGPITEKADHSYPSSSKKRTNWDALVKSNADEEKAAAEAHGKDPNAGGDKALNELFQKLYADATDEQRRAMIKSYQESNGTSLSTNWDEVKKVRPLLQPFALPAEVSVFGSRVSGQTDAL